MRAQEIARADWHGFFGRFTRLHAGAIVSMNVSGPRFGRHNAVVGQPLRGISEEGEDVLIHIGARRRTDHLGHRIVNVRTIRLRQTREGADAALDIDSADGTRTTVAFRSPMLPELLDAGVE